MLTAAIPTRIALDEHTVVDVEPAGPHAELTVSTTTSTGTRSTFGIALTATEARQIASALLDGVAPAFGHAPLDELEEHAAVATRFHPVTPAKAAAAMREARR